MRCVATTVIAALIAGTGAASEAAPPRFGRIIRIARTVPPKFPQLGLCQLYDGDVGACSRAVAVGDLGWLVDSDGAYGQARVTSVSGTADACGITTSWQILVDSSQSRPRDAGVTAALILNHAVADSGRILPASGAPPAARPDEFVVQVIDDNGDGDADLQVTSFPCDQHGAAAHPYALAYQCTDYWAKTRGEWRKVRTDMVPTCQR